MPVAQHRRCRRQLGCQCSRAIQSLLTLFVHITWQHAAAAGLEQGNNYGDGAYWDQRYATNQQTFDWYQSFATLQPILANHIHVGDRVLHVGAGTSTLAEDMLTAGMQPKEIINTDISSHVIQHLQQRHDNSSNKHYPLYYQQADVRYMPEFASGSMDAVIDKGTIDAIRCGSNADRDTRAMIAELYRVLNRGGSLVMVTYGPPFARLPWVMQPGLDWHSVQVYVLNRNQAAVPTAAAAMHDAPEADRGPLTISSSLDEVMPGVHGPIAAHTALELFNPAMDLSHLHFAYTAVKAPPALTPPERLLALG